MVSGSSREIQPPSVFHIPFFVIANDLHFELSFYFSEKDRKMKKPEFVFVTVSVKAPDRM